MFHYNTTTLPNIKFFFSSLQNMSEVSQNPNFHLSKPPHKLSNKPQVVLKNNKPTKRSAKSKYKNTNITTTTTTNNNNNNNNMIMNNNTKPLKVVHISNPMKYKATVAEFRALVQGLTGRDAVVDWPDEHFCGTHQVMAAVAEAADEVGVVVSDEQRLLDQVVHQQDLLQEVNFSASCFGASDHLSYDYFDDANHIAVLEDLRAFIGGN